MKKTRMIVVAIKTTTVCDMYMYIYMAYAR